jgi:Na+-transporting NADH:ubiquinone oxidoreductase subunit NqrF
VFLVAEFEELAKKHPNFQIILALSEQLKKDEEWDREVGFVHLAVDKFLEADSGLKRQAFLCGPPPMIEAVTRVLEEKGVRSENIFYDEF